MGRLPRSPIAIEFGVLNFKTSLKVLVLLKELKVHADLRGDARGAENDDAGVVVVAAGVANGDLEARRRRFHRDRGGGVVARLVVGPTVRPVVLPRDERRADGAVRGDLLNAHLLLTQAPGRRDIEARDAASSGDAEDDALDLMSGHALGEPHLLSSQHVDRRAAVRLARRWGNDLHRQRHRLCDVEVPPDRPLDGERLHHLEDGRARREAANVGDAEGTVVEMLLHCEFVLWLNAPRLLEGGKVLVR